MAVRVDISELGDKRLQRKLHRLGGAVQKRIVKNALRTGRDRVMARVVAGYQKIRNTGYHTDPLIKWAGKKRSWRAIRAKGGHGRIGFRLNMPAREVIGMRPYGKPPEGDPWYHPAHIELGSESRRAMPVLRPAINDHKSADTAAIAKVISNAVTLEVRAK